MSATGRATPTPATSRPRSTTSCCASSFRACARAGSGAEYCDYARRYRGYQVDPPVLTYRGPGAGTADSPVAISFTLSKLSAVELTVTRPDGRVVFSRLATFRRGSGSFSWTPRGWLLHRQPRREGAAHGLREEGSGQRGDRGHELAG